MNKDNMNALSEIVQKLDLITSILLVTSRTEIEKIRGDMSRDPVAYALIKKARRTRYGELVSSVAKETDVSEKTVKRRINDLRSLGLIVDIRDGREVLLSISPLMEGL